MEGILRKTLQSSIAKIRPIQDYQTRQYRCHSKPAENSQAKRYMRQAMGRIRPSSLRNSLFSSSDTFTPSSPTEELPSTTFSFESASTRFLSSFLSSIACGWTTPSTTSALLHSSLIRLLDGPRRKHGAWGPAFHLKSWDPFLYILPIHRLELRFVAPKQTS